MDTPPATWDEWVKKGLHLTQRIYQNVDKILDQAYFDKVPVGTKEYQDRVDSAFKQAFENKDVMSEFRTLLQNAYTIIGQENNPRVNILTNAENTPENIQRLQREPERAPWDTRDPGAPSPSMGSIADLNPELQALSQSNDPNERMLYQLALKLKNAPKLSPKNEPELRNTLKQEYKYTPPKLRPAGQ